MFDGLHDFGLCLHIISISCAFVNMKTQDIDFFIRKKIETNLNTFAQNMIKYVLNLYEKEEIFKKLLQFIKKMIQ